MNKVIYDNDCNFCCLVKSFLYSTDFLNCFQWVPLKNSSIYNVDSTLVENSIVLITSNNIKLIEFHACRYIISRNLILFPLSIFLYIPYISNFFGNKLYKYIARNRKCKNLNL